MFYKIYVGDNLISEKSKLCSGFFSKAKGFMFNFSKEYDSIILDSRNTSIHMFFVFFPLQIAWLNSELEIVDIKNAYPFMPVISSKKSSSYVLELKQKKDIKIGDKISVKLCS